MNPHDEPFVPETVDEQVDQLLQTFQARAPQESAEMVQMLRSIYTDDTRLQQVWGRLHQADRARQASLDGGNR